MRCSTPLLLTCVSSLALVLLIQLLFQFCLEWIEDPNILVHHSTNGKYRVEDVNEMVLIWWTPFTGNAGSFINCGSFQCFVTQDRSFQHHPKFQMFLFYGSNLEIPDLPLPKRHNITWSLLHEESPKNIPFLSHREGISLFNYTATFSRFSDVPLTLQYVPDIESVTDRYYFVPLEAKNELLGHLSPVLYVQSDCDTPLDRDKYVQELMKYVPVDSYGSCLRNKQLPASMTNPMESMNSNEFLHFVARYKFTIAFENAVCEDYITEKLWRPLIVGSVPIYLGSPSIEDWLPNPNSAILALKFSSPKELADYILEVNRNDEKYSAFLLHKEGTITNQYFISEMHSRPWGLPADSDYHYINHFECQMCIQAHHNSNKALKRKVANETEYFCPRPKSSINGKEDPSNPWLHLWEHGKCQATALEAIVKAGHRSIDNSFFNFEMESRFRNGTCYTG